METIIISNPLRKFINQKTRLEVDGSNVKEAIQELPQNFPDLKKHPIDEHGQLRTFVNMFVGDDDIRNLQKENTKVSPDSVVSIISAIAGGKSQTHPFIIN